MAFLTEAANRGSISTGYNIDNSLKFENTNSEGLLRNADGDADDRTKFSFSGWYKRSQITRENWMFAAAYSSLKFMDDDTLRIELYTGSATSYWDTTRKFRDTSAWYHLVFAVDTTLGTAADRVKVWVNGVLQANTNTGTAIAQNATTQFGTDADNYQIGYYFAGGANWRGHCGYMADLHYVDGIVNDADSFGEFDEDSGIWKPKAYAGGYGTNGFNLKFAASGDLGADSSGNSNTYSLSNIAAADQATDTPTNNFATGNAIVYFSNPTMATFNAITEGATKLAKGANGWETLSSTIAVTRGKWYAEIRNETVSESALGSIFPTDADFLFRGGQISNHAGSAAGDGGVSYYSYDGNKYIEGTSSSYGTSWTGSTNTIGIALDMDNGYVYFAKDNTWQNSGVPTSGATGTGGISVPDYTTKPYMIGYAVYSNATDGFINFGGYTGAAIASAASDGNGYGTFEYAPPTGYYALCTKNLAEFG